jgi:dolichol kinase
MALWEQLLAGAIGLLVIFMFFPGIKATMEKSKNAKEKHWGTLLLLTIVLIAFILLLISSVQ